jgi:hypothetical protein
MPSAPRVCALCFVLVAAFGAAACDEPPTKEIQQAQGAIDTARAAGAELYAHDEFAAAEDALKRAQQAVQDRDYRLALNDALDARERAQNAAAQVGDAKAAARAGAERALVEANAALTDAQNRLKAAIAAKAPPRALAQPRSTIEAGEQAVQTARAAFDRGDYQQVSTPIADVTPRLRAAAHDLEAAAVGTTGRRRR